MKIRKLPRDHRVMWRRALICVVVLFCGCQGKSDGQKVTFQIRGLRTEAQESQYATTFTHKATILVLGEEASAKKPILISLRVTRLSGGDPKYASVYPLDFPMVVFDGVGDFSLGGGSRDKKTEYQQAEIWEPEKIKVEVTGYAPLEPVKGVVSQSP